MSAVPANPTEQAVAERPPARPAAYQRTDRWRPPPEKATADFSHLPYRARLEIELRRLNADEALRRHEFVEAIQPGERHEFINGRVVMASPERVEHYESTENLYEPLKAHVKANKLGRVFRTSMMARFRRNDYHPDVCFWPLHTSRLFRPGQTVFPPPDFAAEVLSPSSIQRDREIKFDDYARHGVQEYWILDYELRAVEQYVLTDEREYDLNLQADRGRIKSVSVSGFEMDIPDIFRFEADEQEVSQESE
jgi:Uma2 family endonuclease